MRTEVRHSPIQRVAVLAIALLAVAAIAGSSRLSGPVLLSFGNHGLHLGDLLVVAAAAAAITGVLRRH